MIIRTRYYNDCKERHQSHEQLVESHEFRPTGNGDYQGTLDLACYGSDKEEATENLRAALQHLINDAQETLVALEAGKPTDTDVTTEDVESVAAAFDVVFYRKLKEAVASREFRRKQLADPVYRLNQLLSELKSKIIRSMSENHGLSYTVLEVPLDMGGHATTFFRKHNLNFQEIAADSSVPLRTSSTTYHVQIPAPSC